MPVPPPQRGGKTSGRAAASTSPQRFNPGAAPSCLQLHGLNHKPAEGAAIVTKRGAECRGGAMMACIGWKWEGGGFASIRCRWERWRMAGWLAAGLRALDAPPCPSLLTYPPYINWLVGSVPRIPRNRESERRVRITDPPSNPGLEREWYSCRTSYGENER